MHLPPTDICRGPARTAVYQCPRCKNMTHHIWDWDYIKGEWSLNCICCIYWLIDNKVPLTKEQVKWL